MKVSVVKLRVVVSRHLGGDSTVDVVEEIAKTTGRNRLTLTAAGLAFHGFLAIFPALIAAVGLARLVGLTPAELAALVHELAVVLPHSVATILVDALRSNGSRRADLIAVVAGLAVAGWSSVEAISALQQALDVAFAVAKPHGFLLRRLRAVPLLAVTIVLAGTAVALLVFGTSIERSVAGLLPTSLHDVVVVVTWIIRIVGSLLAIILLLSLHYGAAEGRSWRDWRSLSPGSTIATVGWILASLGYSLYLTHSAGESATYGPLAGVAVLLLWLYLTFIMVLIGAEVDHAIVSQHQSRTNQEPPA
ncbi:YihY/virulence factor BrkB family protein [Ferrimicrobium acidiphilum]|uniref:YihY/virulence factor BrkB family protein n=1 Tax=Ferrimicrobium acidiphilum TaxID=121039 RepID=UPI0023F3C8FD|nr:YihY/virulence factor BrkB family protein [Ferrimicrobium acidiphilum]